MISHSTRALALIAVVNLACSAEPQQVEPPGETKVRPTPDTVDPAMLGHPPMAGLNIEARGPRRMSINQIGRSLEQIGNFPEGSIVLDEGLTRALGEPDYVTVLEESLISSPLFMKFMMDLGAAGCRGFSEAEGERAVEDRIYMRYETPEANIRSMVFRFLGYSGDNAAPYVERLMRVFEATRTQPPGDIMGYEAVCIALFNSPEFLLY